MEKPCQSLIKTLLLFLHYATLLTVKYKNIYTSASKPESIYMEQHLSLNLYPLNQVPPPVHVLTTCGYNQLAVNTPPIIFTQIPDYSANL